MGADADLAGYYGRGRERDRLASPGHGRLELLRTQDLLVRHLPPGGVVLDVGGGPGAYAAWLARRGYTVELYDPVPLHVEQARAAAMRPGAAFSAAVADGRRLPCPDDRADAVVMLGPLYRLPEREERRRCLAEARRVLKAGGVVVAAAISRFASLMDGVARDFLADPVFARVVEEDLARGTHRNPERREGYFTTAYFHRPEELAAELADAGFSGVRLSAVEGLATMVSNSDLSAWLADPARAERLLSALRRVESEPSMLGATAHLIAVARA